MPTITRWATLVFINLFYMFVDSLNLLFTHISTSVLAAGVLKNIRTSAIIVILIIQHQIGTK